jgi:translin
MSKLDSLDTIAEDIRQGFEAKNAARDAAINHSRLLIQQCANAIRAIHRREWDNARQRLDATRTAAEEMHRLVVDYRDLYHSGYVQDALKEYVEAFLTFALVHDDALPSPAALGVEPSTYLNGLAEAASELRRQVLDIIRRGHSDEAERLLEAMDTIYSILFSLDFHDSITGGLRRRVDALRGVVERTRGDVTNSLRQQRLQAALAEFEQRMGLESSQGNRLALELEDNEENPS